MPASNSKRLLIVDDDELVATSIARGLTGFEIEIALEGGAALERLAANNYDLVLCDLHLPDMTGARLESRSQEVAPQARFAFMTGGTSSAELQGFLDGRPHLEKPFSVRELRSFVDDLLEG